MTLNEAIIKYEPVAATLASHAWRSWCRYWSGLWGGRSLSSITTGDLNSQIAKMRREEGRAEETIKSRINVLRQVFTNVGVAFPARVAKQTTRHRVRYFQQSEEFRVKRWMTPEDFSIVELAYSTGLRSSELWNLKKEDVDLAAGFLYVTRGKCGSSGHVPIGKTARRVLAKLLRGTSEWVVMPAGHERLKRNVSQARWKQEVWRPALRAAGVAGFRFHDLRHEAATRIVRDGHSLYVVQAVLRQKSPSSTQRYAHLADKDLKRAVARL